MKIAYLTTHYPSVSHTFIQGEILALEARGTVVLPMALNGAAPQDLLTDVDRSEHQRTFYVKSTSPVSVIAAVLRVGFRHPVALTRTVAGALRWGGSNAGLSMKAVFQVVEAVLVYRYCVRQGVTAIHAHFGHAPASVALFASRLGNAIGRDRWSWSVTIHGYHEFATEDTARLRQKMIEVDGVAAISHFTRAQLMRLSEPRDWPKISVVRCGIDLGVFRLRSATDAGPASSRPLVVVIGRLSPEKGHAVLIDAVEILRDRGVDLDVHCAGEGPLRGELEGRVATAGLSDRVQLLGALPPAEVTQLLHRADVFCLPSFTEGLPVSVMEAMAVGVPVVASAITGMPELVADGATGWTVPAGSATLLADALLRALEAPDREEIVAAARRAVERQHDIRRTIVDLERVLVSAHGGELVQPDESTVDER